MKFWRTQTQWFF